MPKLDPPITSLRNPSVKEVVKLRRRSHRDEANLMIVEGYREIKRAMDNGHSPVSLFTCPALFLGKNEDALIARAREANSQVLECEQAVFEKMAYRDRPEGLLAVAKQVHRGLDDISLSPHPLLLVAESIEKPGNLGTLLRSADAAGADAVIVCDRCTDIWNPNVVRASVGTIFSVPVLEASSADAIAWLKKKQIRILATTPHAKTCYTDVDLAAATAIVVGAEQYGLSNPWLQHADMEVMISMLGQADSLNVAQAATILLYEAVRQRMLNSGG